MCLSRRSDFKFRRLGTAEDRTHLCDLVDVLVYTHAYLQLFCVCVYVLFDLYATYIQANYIRSGLIHALIYLYRNVHGCLRLRRRCYTNLNAWACVCVYVLKKPWLCWCVCVCVYPILWECRVSLTIHMRGVYEYKQVPNSLDNVPKLPTSK